MRNNKDEPSTPGVIEQSDGVLAEVVSIDKGIPVKRNANITTLTAEFAWVEIERELTEGEVIALVIKEADRRVFDLFNFEEVPSSAQVTIKTQGRVDDIAAGSGPGLSKALIRFQGSMRIAGVKRNEKLRSIVES